VRAVAARVEGDARSLQDVVAGERAQQLVVTAARLVRAGDHGIHDAQRGGAADAAARAASARTHASSRIGRMLERAHDGRADRDDARAVTLGLRDPSCGRHGYPVRLVERQPAVQLGIAGR